MANPNPGGSLWRKWDLHVHAPGTKMNDGYATKDGKTDLEQFCKIIHDSDVAVAAITDYFSLDSYFAVKEKYEEMFPNDGKLLLPNLEVRLDLSVNRDGQNVNLHLIFRPTLTQQEADKFLGRLDTGGTTGSTRARTTCKDLSTSQQLESATVSMASIESAIMGTFGEHAAHRSERLQHVLVVASAKGDGIRPGGTNGIQRKRLLTDEVDKFCDAFYGNPGSRDYFIDVNRLEGDEKTSPKPVFDGCDAHSFDDLCAGLGKHITQGGPRRNTTWIKADPTYVGLLQTLIEPDERVAMQAAEPDQKEPYKLINKVVFTGPDFPAEVIFNRNLNSVIGSRSSGKSALLAFIAHAVDPAETIRIQLEAAGMQDESKAGPAAGLTWDDVAETTCRVEWESGPNTSGRVIYIPQNSLYTLSEQPDEITKKIAPALFRTYPSVKMAFDRTTSKVSAANADVRTDVDKWFGLADQIEGRTQEIKDLGDKTAITAERDRLQQEVERIKAATELTDDEVSEYQEIEGEIDRRETRLAEIAKETDQLSPFVTVPTRTSQAKILPQSVQASITVRPLQVEIPDKVAADIENLKTTAAQGLILRIQTLLVEVATALGAEQAVVTSEISNLKAENAALIVKHEANEELARVVAEHKKQVASLAEIAKRESARDKLLAAQQSVIARLTEAIADRATALETLEATFEAENRILADLEFGIETAVTEEASEHASIGLNQRSINAYAKHESGRVDYENAQTDPARFLAALRNGKVKPNKGYDPKSIAADILAVTKEIRFSAELDGDRIGGFERSSMTPGKQALFALTLILNESEEPWPLLIDQPEDDLDSRSIYETIVPYLVERKKERQIIMVSHNANLVIGADSEQVIVANRHGEDRKNASGRTFEYFTGALEHSQELNKDSPTTLGRFGIREHACEILDGGEEAFRKRRDKYRVRAARV